MKKILVIVLLVPILALTMISCDADMRSNLANLMGGFNSNVLIDGGLVKVNNANAEAAAVAIKNLDSIGSADIDEDTFGIDIVIPAGVTTMLKPQSKPDQDTLKNNIADALNSPDQKKNLLEELKKPITADQKTAAEGTQKVFNLILDDLAGLLTGEDITLGDTLKKLKLPEIGDSPTQGDLLTLQLMTDLISNTIASLKEIGGGTLVGVTDTKLGDSTNKAKVLSIVDDALFAAEIAEQISGAASIDFTGQINLGDLMDSLGDRSSRSRGEAIALTDAADFLGTINALAPSIVDLMGITYEGTSFVYDAAKYKSFLLNQQIYRSAMDQALKMMELGKLKKKDVDKLTFDTSTLVKYALAVFITEHDAFWQDEKDDDTPTPDIIIALYLNASASNKNLGLGALTDADIELIQPTGITEFNYDNWSGFLKTRDKAYYQGIVSNIIRINDEGGISLLGTELKKFYDPEDSDSTEDGLSDWYSSLAE